MSSSITSGDFVLPQAGEDLCQKRFTPDLKNQNGNVNVELTLNCIQPSQLQQTGHLRVSPTTTKDTRARGRQASLKITSSTDTKWRYGTYRADVQPDGMR